MTQSQDHRLAGICGIYCGSCPAYLAPRQGDGAEVAKLARENNMAIKDVGCDGCLSDRLMPECRECRHGFRACVKQNHITRRFQCQEFPCQRLEEFRDVHIRNGASHHQFVIAELRRMKDGGVEAWLNRKSRENACLKCGRALYWFERECRTCGHPVNRA
jgi:hypothetical protein